MSLKTWHTCYHRDWEPSVPVAWDVYQPPSHLYFLPDICPLSSATMCDATAPTLRDGAPPMALKCRSAALLPNHCRSIAFLRLAAKLMLPVWTRVDFPIHHAARSYRMSSPQADLFKYYHKQLTGSPLSCPPTRDTHQVAGFRRPLTQHSTFPS